MQFNDTQPIWLQIYDYACRAILAGRWTEQARIPSVRELAVTLEVNPNTVPALPPLRKNPYRGA